MDNFYSLYCSFHPFCIYGGKRCGDMESVLDCDANSRCLARGSNHFNGGGVFAVEKRIMFRGACEKLGGMKS